MRGSLTLVVAAQPGSAGDVTRQCVDLVDEDDRRGAFTGFAEQVAHPWEAPTPDEHLHERERSHRQERYLRLAERLPCEAPASLPGGPTMITPRFLGTCGGVAWIAQVVDDLAISWLDPVELGDVVEAGGGLAPPR